MPRLPSDSVLLVLDRHQKTSGDGLPARTSGTAQRSADLISAWRGAKMPIVHAVRDRAAPDENLTAARLLDEPVFAHSSPSAFLDSGLEAALNDRGATTLIVCSDCADDAVAATARHAIALGYRVLIAADACGAADSPSLASLRGDDVTITDAAALLDAVCLASAIRTMRAERLR